ncbi:MAG: hypothetical protein JWN02_1763, partial [Acidobacteria bacterium]|nr:hypothetical protein [Acidobacteriota bacterium]
MLKTTTATALLLFAAVTTAAAADAPAALPAPPPLTLHRAAGAITVDGDLGDPGWRDAAVIDRFYETSPGDNTPPKVKTQAYLTYDDRYFYIGIRAEDPHPDRIRAPYVERDAVIGTDDNIAIFLDPRNDKRSAIELRVNPRGIQADGIYNDANGNEDFSPDFFYDTAAKIDAGGWSAELRIPFSSLRYPHTDPQTWNILVWRNYPREFRYAFQSAPVARDSNCYVCHMHPLIGLTGLPEAGHFVAAPYVTVQGQERPTGELGSSLGNRDTKTAAGLDVKWNPSATNVVDLTLNPDFSQVEADVAAITVNQRFAVFFPEKRPFFLEGFDLFDTPLQVAYTRTITAPRWGIRSTGKIAGTAYTVLVTDDRGGGLVVLPSSLGSDFAPQDFKSLATIARVRRSIGASYVGAVLTDREVTGGGHNRVFGPDFQWRPTDKDFVTGQVLVSDTTNPDRPDLSPAYDGKSHTSQAVLASYGHNQQRMDWFADFRDIGKEFRADLGFVPQVGYREEDAGFGLRFYPEKGALRFLRPSIFVDRQTDPDIGKIFQQVSVAINVQGVKNLAAGIALRPREQVYVGGKLLEQTYWNFAAQIDPSRRYPRITLNGHLGESIDYSNARVGRGGL